MPATQPTELKTTENDGELKEGKRFITTLLTVRQSPITNWCPVW